MDNTAVSQNFNDVNNNDALSEELRKRVYDMLADNLIKALQQPNTIFTVEDAQQSAEYISNKLETVQTKEELFFFLKQLAEQWPQYQIVFDELQKEEIMSKVHSELQQLQ